MISSLLLSSAIAAATFSFADVNYHLVEQAASYDSARPYKIDVIPLSIQGPSPLYARYSSISKTCFVSINTNKDSQKTLNVLLTIAKTEKAKEDLASFFLSHELAHCNAESELSQALLTEYNELANLTSLSKEIKAEIRADFDALKLKKSQLSSDDYKILFNNVVTMRKMYWPGNIIRLFHNEPSIKP